MNLRTSSRDYIVSSDNDGKLSGYSGEDFSLDALNCDPWDRFDGLDIGSASSQKLFGSNRGSRLLGTDQALGIYALLTSR